MRVVLVRDGRAEERHHAVAGVLVDRAFETVHALSEDDEEAVEERVELFGVHLLRELHRAFDVGEEHRHLFPLALERAARRESALGEVLGSVRATVAGRCRDRRPDALRRVGSRARHRRTARITEAGRRPKLVPTRTAAGCQGPAAGFAEPRLRPITVAAGRTRSPVDRRHRLAPTLPSAPSLWNNLAPTWPRPRSAISRRKEMMPRGCVRWQRGCRRQPGPRNAQAMSAGRPA